MITITSRIYAYISYTLVHAPKDLVSSRFLIHFPTPNYGQIFQKNYQTL